MLQDKGNNENIKFAFFFAGQIKNKCLKSFTKPVQFQILKKKNLFGSTVHQASMK